MCVNPFFKHQTSRGRSKERNVLNPDVIATCAMNNTQKDLCHFPTKVDSGSNWSECMIKTRELEHNMDIITGREKV